MRTETWKWVRQGGRTSPREVRILFGGERVSRSDEARKVGLSGREESEETGVRLGKLICNVI